MRVSALGRRSLLKRWLKRIGIGLGALLALVLLLVAIAWGYVTSEAGGERALRITLGILGDTLAGRFEAKHVSLSGGIVVLDDVKLYTPENELVGELKHAEIDVALLPLINKDVIVRSAKLEGVRMYFVDDERGLNIVRAVALKHPSAVTQAPSTVKFKVDVQKLGIFDSFVQWPPYSLEGIHLDGHAVISGVDLRIDGALAGTAQLMGDTPLPLTLAAKANSPKGDDVRLDVVASLADTTVDGTFGFPAKVFADVREAHATPDVLKRFVSRWPLKVPVDVKGHLDFDGAQLSVEAGHGSAELNARYHGTAVDALTLSAKDVDLSELFGEGKPSRIALEATGHAANLTAEGLDGALKLNGVWSEPQGQQLASVAVDSTASAGKLVLEKAEVVAPGVRFHARGDGSLHTLHASGQLDASDLSKLGRAIFEMTGEKLPPLGGHGKLAVAIEGATLHPGIAAAGTFEALRISNVQASGVKVDVKVPDILRPFEEQALLDAARVSIDEKACEHVHARVGTQGRALDVEVSTQGLADVNVLAKGEVDADGLGIALSALTLHYPEADWTLVEPTHLAFENGVSLDLTKLDSGGQRLEVRAREVDGRLDAAVDAHQVDMAKLPAALIPSSLNLSGVLEAHATAVGALVDPKTDAQVTVKDATVRDVKDIAFVLDAHYASDRVQAKLSGHSSIGSIEAHVDVPLRGLKDGRDVPIQASVALTDVVLDALGPLFVANIPVKGHASLTLEASGTAKKPLLTVHAETKKAVVPLPDGKRTLDLDTASVDIAPGRDGMLSAVVVAHAYGADADLRLFTQLTLEGLRKNVPTASTWKSLPLQLTAAVQHLDLARLADAALVDDSLGGKVTFTAHATGSIEQPDVDAEAQLMGVKQGRVKPLDGTVAVKSLRDQTHITLVLSHEAQPLVSLDAMAQVPLERFANLEALATTPFAGNGTIGPLTLSQVLEPVPDQTTPQGTVKLVVTASGTPAGPRVQVRGVLDNVAVGKVALGHADVSADYANAVASAAVTLLNGNAGELDAKGTAKIDLSQGALLKGVNWKSAPFNIKATSKALELAFLSGITERVPRVGGVLDADATVSGTLGDPALVGHASWKKGTLALLGYGDYRDISLELDGSDEAVTLQELYAKCGGGYVKLEGSAVKKDAEWKLKLAGNAQHLPLIIDDQLKATLTLALEVEGVGSSKAITLHKVQVPRATIELPDVKSKDLQDLDRPGNIVLVRDGVPLNSNQQRRLGLGKGKSPLKKSTALPIRLTLDAPRNIWVKSSDVQIELGFSENFGVEIDNGVALTGDISVKRGSLEVIGRKFDVDAASTVHFNGAPTRAYVNITATYKNDREGVTVFATVTGQMPQFAIHLTSNPAMAESDIFTLIATGRRQLKEGSSQAITAEQAASVVGAFAASQLKGVLAKKVPIDVLSVESGTDGFKGTRLEAGKYLTDRFYVGYQIQYGADPKKGENTNAGKVEFQFAPNWSFDVYGGDAGAFGADVVWSKNY